MKIVIISCIILSVHKQILDLEAETCNLDRKLSINSVINLLPITQTILVSLSLQTQYHNPLTKTDPIVINGPLNI
jgi:hypothetical protein